MKKVMLYLAISISFGSHSQVVEPLPIEKMMKASLNEHKTLWRDMGYDLVSVNDKWCMLNFENEKLGLNTFIDFKPEWGSVEEIALTFKIQGAYDDILQYAISNLKEEKSDGASRFFMHTSETVRMKFFVLQYETGKVYVIKLTTIQL
jgi:hypothetical protein